MPPALTRLKINAMMRSTRTNQQTQRSFMGWAVRISGRAWFAVSCIAIAIVAPLPYLTTSLADMTAADEGLANHYLNQPMWIQKALLVHAATAGVALLLTPLGTSTRLRRRWPKLHRVSGRILTMAILTSSIAGLLIAQVSYAGLGGKIGFTLLAILWATAAVRSVFAARKRNYANHRRWAVYTCALTYAGVTLRLWTGLLIAIQQPDGILAARQAFDHAYALMPFLSWIPNIVIAHLWVSRRPSFSNA
jgi:uncharacterized membrane protein